MSELANMTTDMPPGTELMRSTSDHHMAESKKSHQVLVPTPSNNINDPLNWSFTWKLIVILNQTLFVYFSILPALSIAPVTPIFVQQFGASPATVSLFLGICVITLGYANFIIIPFSNIFGRRAACLVCGMIIIGSNIWQALAKDTGSFFGARALNGLGTAVNESVMVQVIADVFFLHERATWMGLYFAAYFMGCFTGPIIAGNMAEYISWHSFFWLCTGVSVFNFVTIVFLFPETKFHRDNSAATKSSSSSDIAIAIAEEKRAGIEQTEALESQDNLGGELGRGKPSRGQFAFAQRPFPGAVASLARDFVTPVYILAFPIILWAVLVVGGAANTLLAMNLTQSAVFSAPPYNFTPGNVGFVNFAFVVGGLTGLVTAGPFSDWLAKKLTVRNNYLREPEMRILAMIPYFVIMVLGCAVIAAGYKYAWAWQAIVVLGYFCIGVQVVALPTIAVAYAVDCYKPISGEILVICTVFKNTFGFGMAWWVPELTPTQSVMVLFATNAGACLLGVPIYFYGKKLRVWTRNSKVHGMEAVM